MLYADKRFKVSGSYFIYRVMFDRRDDMGFSKAGLSDSLPFWSAGMRFMIASILIAAFLLARRQFVLSKELLVLSFLNGIMYFSVPFGSVYWASLYLPSGLVSILAASISVFALMINRLVKGHRRRNCRNGDMPGFARHYNRVWQPTADQSRCY